MNSKTKDGCICPTCDSHRVVKAYRLNRDIVRALCRLRFLNKKHKLASHRDAWARTTAHGYDITYLRFHGLIRQPTTDSDKPFNRSGLWALTALGEKWIRGSVQIPVEVYVDNNKKIGESSARWSIADALEEPWNPQSPYEKDH